MSCLFFKRILFNKFIPCYLLVSTEPAEKERGKRWLLIVAIVLTNGGRGLHSP